MSSIVSNLLVLAVAGLIVDEVVASRRRRDRAVSVAVQGLIVYSQSRRAYNEVVATSVDRPLPSGAEELRTLASMLLTASPSLFDDPVTRPFLKQANQFAGSLFRAISSSPTRVLNANERTLLESEMSQLRATAQPLLARIPPTDRSSLDSSREMQLSARHDHGPKHRDESGDEP